MTSVNSTNYGSIHISDDRDQTWGEGEKTGDREETYQELQPTQPESWKSRHKQFFGKIIMLATNVTSTQQSAISGLSLAFISGGFFTANNFFINQFHVSVPDLLLVRTLMQMLIYSSICYYR